MNLNTKKSFCPPHPALSPRKSGGEGVRKLRFLTLTIGLFLSATAALAQAPGAEQGPRQTFSFFIPLLLVFGIFYLLIIRPQQKQAKKHQVMLKAIEKGNLVVTSGGIHGRVVGVTENILTVEIADNVRVKVERSGIQAVKGEEKSEK